MSSSVSRLPWWSQWRMTPTTATKVDPFQKNISHHYRLSAWLKRTPTQAGKQRTDFCRNCIKSSLSFFPICCTSALSIFPRLSSTNEKRRNETVWNLSRDRKKIVYEFEMANTFCLSFPFVFYPFLLILPISHLFFPFLGMGPWIGK